VSLTEAGRGGETLEAKHRAGALLHFAVTLLQQIIGVARRAMDHIEPELEPKRAGVRTVAVGSDAQRATLTEHAGRAKELPGSGKIARLAQAYIK